jgi:uncharacterized RmlC-like cupin family protein
MIQPDTKTGVETTLQQLFVALSELLAREPAIAAPFIAGLPKPPFLAQRPTGEADLPICRFWPHCLDAGAAADPVIAQFAAALRQLTPSLRWRQNPNYRQAPPSDDFLANYGYVEICGSYGLVAAEIRFGVLVLGPGTCYPPHRHPAEEIYIPLGYGSWQRGEADVTADHWVEQPAGKIIHHPPFVPHATRGLDHALAAIYLWRGDLATEAKLDETAS